MDDTDELSVLTLDQVTQLISQATSAGANPMLVGVQIFNNLGDNVTVSGPTLTLALATLGVQIDASLAPLLSAIQNISKAGSHVSIALNQDTELSLKNTRVRFAKDTTFDVRNEVDSSSLNNIVGLTGHKVIWVDIVGICLTQSQGRWSVAVKTPVRTINFQLN